MCLLASSFILVVGSRLQLGGSVVSPSIAPVPGLSQGVPSWWRPTNRLGEISLLIATLMRAVHQQLSRKLAREVGGVQESFIQTTAVAAVLCSASALLSGQRRALFGFWADSLDGFAWAPMVLASLGFFVGLQIQGAVAASAPSSSHIVLASVAASCITTVILDRYFRHANAQPCNVLKYCTHTLLPFTIVAHRRASRFSCVASLTPMLVQ